MNHQSTACLGCKLANEKGVAHVVYENEYVTCLLDIEPMNEGHLLILPKKHYLDVEELDSDTAAAIMSSSAFIAKVLKQLFQPDGITIIQNGGLFNDLGHYHMHVFPRYQNDGFSWNEPLDSHKFKHLLAETRLKIIHALH
ncbi:Diadenosine tetraphosphate (Ap4A) hydrolase [Paenibacillus sp. 1_12]|uniref:HIT family protein n=1 Tax=Paenibacillus sp. 1_12 TaxID=1566278 RepID=UPI0008E35FAC|nr:HIT family protein [Paenibacillus sp. 1_12]SFL34748.1 Diadenosine tetraphosphate (Ap4A) hydrolase [Paenibacillus sp. 1_12]